MRSASEVTSELKLRAQLDDSLLLLELILNDIHFYMDVLINSILFAKANILHPFVLSPTKIVNHLQSTIQHIPTATSFALPLTYENAAELMQAATLTVYFSNNKLVFVIANPLITQAPYNLYKINPLPVSKNQHEFLFIHPTANYLA